eukprot:3732168-Pleurochrysis_carterae.AAC.3
MKCRTCPTSERSGVKGRCDRGRSEPVHTQQRYECSAKTSPAEMSWHDAKLCGVKGRISRKVS